MGKSLSGPLFCTFPYLIEIKHHYLQQAIANKAVGLQPGDPVLPQVDGHQADQVLQHPRTDELNLVSTKGEITQLG